MAALKVVVKMHHVVHRLLVVEQENVKKKRESITDSTVGKMTAPKKPENCKG